MLKRIKNLESNANKWDNERDKLLERVIELEDLVEDMKLELNRCKGEKKKSVDDILSNSHLTNVKRDSPERKQVNN